MTKPLPAVLACSCAALALGLAACQPPSRDAEDRRAPGTSSGASSEAAPGTAPGTAPARSGGIQEMTPPPGAELRQDEAAPAPAPPAGPKVPAIADGLTDQERRDIEIFRRASAAVVNITAIAERQRPFSFDVMQIPRGTGSGFLWDKDGHVVTNYHVVAEADRVSVTLSDRSEWEAEKVGEAPNKDLAVLRIKAPRERLVPLTIGRSGDLQVGQQVLAVGNPFGLDHSLTVGIVSALGRELESPGGMTIKDVIQTDAAINPGNSGGPLLDSGGRLVGVNSAIYSPSGAFAGIGFAVPVDTVKRLVPQLIATGRALQPGIGVGVLPDGVARRYKFDGVVIASVQEGTPAAQAGLQGMRRTRGGYEIGDQIVAVNGTKIETVDDMWHTFEDAGVGATVTLTVERQGRRRDVKVRLVDVK